MKQFFTSLKFMLSALLKFMLSALLLCLAIGAQAGDVVFNGTTDTNGKTDAGEDQLTKNGVTLSVSRGLLASSNGQYRTYKGETLTISSTVGAITQVVFTCTAKDDAQYGPGCFTAAPGNYSFEGNTGTWNGAANEVVFTAGSNQVRATEIVVTVDGDTPVDPDPDPDPDPEPSATYTSIAAMKTAATADKTDVKFQFKDLLVTYVNGVYSYVSDGTDGFLFYGSSELVAGDKMTGSVTGKLYQYNGLNEMSDNSFTIDSKTSGNAVTAQNVDVASILSDYRNYESEYVKISGVTFNGTLANGVTVSQNGSDLTLYNRFNLTYDVNTAHKYDIYGFLTAAKKAKIKNGQNIRYHVEINTQFWENRAREKGISPNTTAFVEMKDEFIASLRDYLGGANNSDKLLWSEFSASIDGKSELHNIKVNVVDTSKAGNEYNDDVAEASNVLAYSDNVHPNLAGATPGKSQMNNSGSDKRELFTMKQALETMPHDMMITAHNTVIYYNEWEDKVYPDVPMIILTTLDKNTDAKQVTTNNGESNDEHNTGNN